MVVRIHIVNGKTKVYETYRGVGGDGEHGPDKYVTNCGMEWKSEPKPYETCDHIDCALDIQRQRADNGPKAFLFALVIGIVLLFMIKDGGIWFLGFSVLVGLSNLIGGIKAGDKVHELTEYQSKGTIKGMRAYISPASEELADLKSVKECTNYGLVLYNKGRYDDAIKAFDKAIEQNPNSAAAWNKKGIALKAQNKLDEAILAFDKAIKLDPELADACYNKGVVLGTEGKYDEAIQAYNKAIEIDPKGIDAWYNRGIALRLLGRTTEAYTIFAHAKRELNRQGNDLSDLERYAEAINAYDMALAGDPNYVNAWINKGTAFFKLGRYEEAIATFNHVIKIDPKHGDAWNRKGVVLKKIGCKVEADDAFAKAKELGYPG